MELMKMSVRVTPDWMQSRFEDRYQLFGLEGHPYYTLSTLKALRDELSALITEEEAKNGR